MWGAEATEQGNCSAFKATVPHCCEKRPVIIDLTLNRTRIVATKASARTTLAKWLVIEAENLLDTVHVRVKHHHVPLRIISHDIQYFNDVLLQAGEGGGNAQTEILFHKDEEGIFTFSDGWAFPRRIMFNGDECVMPPPDHSPTLLLHQLQLSSPLSSPCCFLNCSCEIFRGNFECL
ncbi:hypothetical protein LWI29_000608 [Acer saccharum]|uniref:COBRA C-terminal domain-containing protein n=1 Tax=Acer saccharum TaxID=4024 RepID=A0AA39S9K5_ACESA|nr:hypothetical protein LWI29_000608 [Acer saccharum]